MSRQRRIEKNGSPRALWTTKIGLLFAPPVAIIVSGAIYIGFESIWSKQDVRAALAGTLLLIILVWLNWYFGARPLKAILAGVDELRRSRFTFRFTWENEDEFGQISKQFNRLLEALSRAEAEVANLKQVLRWREEMESEQMATPMQIVQSAMQKFSRDTDPDILAESAVQIFFKDLRADRCLLVVCHEATDILSLEAAGQEPGQRISERIHVTAFPNSEKELMALSGWPAWEMARQWKTNSGLDVLSQPVEVGGTFLGYVAVFREIRWRFSSNDQALFGALVKNLAAALQNLRLHERSVTDGLTGLFTRRLMEDMLEKEFVKAKGAQLPLSVLMIDVNDFKQINDKLGHMAGDEVLQHIAKYVRGCVRSSADYPCRYGGDEFLVLLVGANMDAALQVGKRLLKEVEGSKELPRLSSGDKVSLSIGVASFPTHAETKAKLLDLADKAMYEAKGQGGNVLREAGKTGEQGKTKAGE
jgi:diguanylate cyclase (GGDEF)-like protein